MTAAVSLFDVLARDAPAGEAGATDRLAEAMVRSALEEWERLKEYERQFSPSPAEWSDRARAMEITRSIYSLFGEWLAEAEQVVERTRELRSAGRPVANAEALEDACGFAHARQKMTPELVAHAMEQVRSGQFVPAKELRDELHARLRHKPYVSSSIHFDTQHAATCPG